MTRLELLIFDCDGVLVDSEPLAIALICDEANRLGWALSLRDAEEQFPRGGTLERCMATISNQVGRPLPDDFVPRFRARLYEALRERVQPIPGVTDVIEALSCRYCVASNGPREKIRASLGTVGLLERFEGRIFTAYELERSKPFPDLYLHAAATLEAQPARCVVVEDSVPGVQAGLAAGMRVLGYGPNPAQADELRAAGAEPFAAMADLLGLLGD